MRAWHATLPGVSFRVLCCYIADEDLETDHIDAVKAFTQSDVDHLIYVEMPEGFESQGCVLLLFKALEGIKQGAYLWYQHNKEAWTKLGFSAWINEANLYYHPTLQIRVGVFADDTLVGYPTAVAEDYKNIKAEYAKIIKIDSVSLSPVLKFTGVQLIRNRTERLLTIHQHRYIEQMVEEFKSELKQVETPFGASKDARHKFDNLELASDDSVMDRGEYLKLMGKLVWPSTMTRVDIAFAVNSLCTLVSKPSREHYNLGLNIVSYPSDTRNLGITYGGRLRIPEGLSEFPPGFEESCGLHMVHDSSFGTKVRPMAGHVVMYNNGAVDWRANQLKIVPDNSHEAESASGSRAAKAAIFVRQLLLNNGRTVIGATAALGDNRALYLSVQQDGATSRTRYYERAIMLLKRAVLLRILAPYLVGTDNMIADMHTKAVEKGAFVRFRNIMMNVNVGLRNRLKESIAAYAGSTRKLACKLLDRL